MRHLFKKNLDSKNGSDGQPGRPFVADAPGGRAVAKNLSSF
jgi:hypothetical protein